MEVFQAFSIVCLASVTCNNLSLIEFKAGGWELRRAMSASGKMEVENSGERI